MQLEFSRQSWTIPVLATALLACAPNAWAEAADEFDFKLGLQGTYSNNFYYESANERAVSGAVLSPVIEYTRTAPAADFGATAKGEFAAHSYGKQDNYADWFGSGTVNLKLPRQTILGFTAIAEYGHDPFGTNRTEGQSSINQKLDEWSEYSGNVALVGGQDGTTRIGYELKYSVKTREYETNLASTQFLDRQFNTGSATLLYHFSPKLSVLAQGLHYTLDYDQVRTGGIDRSGEAVIGMLGLRWAATAKTSGDLRAGRGQWKPDDPSTEDTNTVFYQASLTWEPTRRSTWRLSGGREYSPTYRFDAVYIDSNNVALEWAQLWTYRSSTKITVGYSDRDFVGAGEKHELLSVTGRYSYQLDRDLHVYLQSRFLDRDAVAANEQFDATIATIGLEAKFN